MNDIQQISRIQCAMKEIRERDESSNETANFTLNEEFDLWIAQLLHAKLKEKGLL